MSTQDIATLRQRTQGALEAHRKAARTVTVLSCLLAAHDALGYLPQEAIEEVARSTDHTINDVWGVASFYTNFRFTSPGEHTVEVCWGPTCHLVGAMNVLQAVQEALGLQGEGETADGRISLKYNTCLGACSQAPVIRSDEHVLGGMTPARALALLASLRHKQT
ncbi:MAG: NAD(P)H-dependent oxidoreductase subunit E [Dehalococcoidia bacterium]|nr:NAD(P)H-dependent oxidoreductase subunit E [Dehalococcoidia bacterium]